MGTYGTWNPADKNAGVALADSNLTAYLASGSGYRGVRGNISKNHGKWYFEVSITTVNAITVGAGTINASLNAEVGSDIYAWGCRLHTNLTVHAGGYTGSLYIFTAGNIFSCAVDIDTGMIWFAKNGVWFSIGGQPGNPGATINRYPSYTDVDLQGTIFPMVSLDVAGQITANFGQSAFIYTPPSGFSAWGDIDLEWTSGIILSDAMDNLQPDADQLFAVRDLWTAERNFILGNTEGFSVTDSFDAEKAIGLYMTTDNIARISDIMEADVDINGVDREPFSIWDTWYVQYTIQNYGAVLTLPAYRVTGEAYDSCFGDANLKIPAYTVSGEVVVHPIANANLTLPALRVTGSGATDILLNASLTIPMLRISGGSEERLDINASLKIPMYRISGSIVQGAVINANLTIPMFKVTTEAYDSVIADANLTLPMLKLFAEISPAAADFLSMVMNIKNNALSLYQGYAFNSFYRFNGIHLGAESRKISNINSGDDDNGVDIEWNIRLPYLDTDVRRNHRLRQAWVSYKSNGNLILSICTPDGSIYEYDLENVEITEDGIRVKVGKGIGSKYIALDIKSLDNSTIDLDMIRLNLDNLGSR
jgi:hypothetical protein